jgi:hypothetical protein
MQRSRVDLPAPIDPMMVDTLPFLHFLGDLPNVWASEQVIDPIQLNHWTTPVATLPRSRRWKCCQEEITERPTYFAHRCRVPGPY